MNRKAHQRQCTLENLASQSNLFAASRLAMKGKRRRPDVDEWARREEANLAVLRGELLDGSWEPGDYRFFEITEPKRRLISAAPFRDRVAHHALCRVMGPLLQRRFIARSFSCQIGKGTTAARDCCRQLVNRHSYVLKCDVSKFFHQIDQAILLKKLESQIRCPDVLNICCTVLGSYHTGGEIPPALFPDDDLVEVTERKRGLPIGNLTSQLWGNFYLDAMDHHLTEIEGHGAYLRYTDDFLLFSNTKERLWELHQIIEEQLLGLRLKYSLPKSRMLATREGVPFCGFRFQPGLAPRILGATKRRFESRRHRLYRGGVRGAEITRSIFAFYQFSREGNTEGLRRAWSRWPLNPGLRRRRGRIRRVLRGGSWNNNNRDNLLSSNRNSNTPTTRNNNNGFRCVISR